MKGCEWMKITLANKTELHPILVTGATKYVQGANRDSLTFIFDDTHSMDEMDSVFTDAACEVIRIVGDDGSEAIHTGYTIRMELTKKSVEVQKATESAEAVCENRIFVTMAQRTYTEERLDALETTTDDMILMMAEMIGG